MLVSLPGRYPLRPLLTFGALMKHALELAWAFLTIMFDALRRRYRRR